MTDKTTETNEADAKIAAENKKLKDQIASLMADQKAAKKEAEEAREAAEAAAEEKARAANDLAALEESLTKKFQKQIEAAKKEAEGFKAQLTERDQSLQTLLIDNALTAKMVELNVSPNLQPALKAMLKGDAKVEGTEALIGDKPLAEFMTEWSQSEAAKDFIRAPSNTGSGATGGSGEANPTDLASMLKAAGAQF